MIFFKLLVAVAMFQQVLSQSEQIGINVGEGGLYIVHASLRASIGDTIVFGFSGPGPTNYSLVQSSYANPCWPLANGFYSGFVPVPLSHDDHMTRGIALTDSACYCLISRSLDH
jgi:hypothetical protein